MQHLHDFANCPYFKGGLISEGILTLNFLKVISNLQFKLKTMVHFDPTLILHKDLYVL